MEVIQILTEGLRWQQFYWRFKLQLFILEGSKWLQPKGKKNQRVLFSFCWISSQDFLSLDVRLTYNVLCCLFLFDYYYNYNVNSSCDADLYILRKSYCPWPDVTISGHAFCWVVKGMEQIATTFCVFCQSASERGDWRVFLVVKSNYTCVYTRKTS